MQAASARQAATVAANGREQTGYVARHDALEADIAQVSQQKQAQATNHRHLHFKSAEQADCVAKPAAPEAGIAQVRIPRQNPGN